jgi:hypothetical protein
MMDEVIGNIVYQNKFIERFDIQNLSNGFRTRKKWVLPDKNNV